jgi:hypothetical protein
VEAVFAVRPLFPPPSPSPPPPPRRIRARATLPVHLPEVTG